MPKPEVIPIPEAAQQRLRALLAQRQQVDDALRVFAEGLAAGMGVDLGNGQWNLSPEGFVRAERGGGAT